MTTTDNLANVATSEPSNVAPVPIGEPAGEITPAALDNASVPEPAGLPSDQLSRLAAAAAQTAAADPPSRGHTAPLSAMLPGTGGVLTCANLQV